jgi:chitinase
MTPAVRRPGQFCGEVAPCPFTLPEVIVLNFENGIRKRLVRRFMLAFAGLALGFAGASSLAAAQSFPADAQSSAKDWRQEAPKLVGYLPDYDGSYAYFAQTLDFSKMTHLYLAFGLPPFCNGTCTKDSDMTFSLGQTDADIHTLVKTAHKAGVKVVLSIGGGGGDQQILQFYNAGLSVPLVRSLNKYVADHDLDGVDLDIEDPNNMGEPYAEFTKVLIDTFHPQGKIVTAAVAEYLQDSMPDQALHMFDFVNVMNYSNYSDAEQAMTYYAGTKKVPKQRMTLGVPFFAQSGDGNIEETWDTVVAAYPNAFDADMVSGGSLDLGVTLYYVGGATMARETELGKKYGGIMIWELSQDAPPPNSLYQVIEEHFPPKRFR